MDRAHDDFSLYGRICPGKKRDQLDRGNGIQTSQRGGGTCLGVCLQVPAQMGTDYTPITFVYSGADASQCAQYLGQQNSGKTGWEAAHPATIVAAVPAGSPVCSGTVGGLSIAIYGTAAAQYACSMLKLK